MCIKILNPKFNFFVGPFTPEVWARIAMSFSLLCIFVFQYACRFISTCVKLLNCMCVVRVLEMIVILCEIV